MRAAAAIVATLIPGVAAAQDASPALKARIAALPAIIGGTAPYVEAFTPAFRAAVPEPAFRQLGNQLVAQFGPLQRVEIVTVARPDAATVRLRFARGQGLADIAVDAAPPHAIAGLLLKGVTPDDLPATLPDIAAAFAALPGQSAFVVAKLGDGAPVHVVGHQPDKALAIGSEFKLIVLAELARAVNAGERRWTDRVILTGAPVAGGRWAAVPKGTAVPIRELATQMIATSDNSATDILIHALGRKRIEAMLPVVGIVKPSGMRPFLTTREAFALKASDATFPARWAAANEKAKRAMLAGPVAHTPTAAIAGDRFAGPVPLSIDTIEWFASPADMVRVVDWLRRHGDATVHAILRTNPGVGPDVAAKWQGVGYKGGSEPGVLAQTFLLKHASGQWFAVSAKWNDTAKPIDMLRFTALVAQAVARAAP